MRHVRMAAIVLAIAGTGLVHAEEPHTASAQEEQEVTTLVGEEAPPFSLEDQHRTERAISFPREKPTILVFADRKGSEQLEGWLDPLHQQYGEQIFMEGVAQLASVPWLFHGVARRAFRNTMDTPVLLDFEGDVCEQYAYVEDRANVFVVSPEGSIAMRVNGPSGDAHFEAIRETLAQWDVWPRESDSTKTAAQPAGKN